METWVNVDGYGGKYEVSNLGNVRTGTTILKTTLNYGYRQVGLWLDGKRVTRRVHRLVAVAFIGPSPTAEHVINHKDGVRSNNLPSNLEWVLQKENVRHAIDVLGKHWRGEASAACTTTEDQVRRVKGLIRSGVNDCAIARMEGRTRSFVRSIRTGNTWGHLV